MPFDALPEKLISDLLALRLAREGIKTGWQQGPFGIQGEERHCLVGWLLASTDYDMAETTRLAVDYVWPALPVHAKRKTEAKIENVWHYNDACGRKHGDVLKVMDDAIALAEKVS